MNVCLSTNRRPLKRLKMKKTSCESCESSCLIQKYCSPEWVRKMDQIKCQLFFKQNQDIVNENSPILGGFFVQSGKVKIYSTGLNQRQQIVRFANPGHIIGHRGAEKERYPIGAKAMDDSVVCFIENKVLDELFEGNPKFVQELMKFYSRELRKIENRMKNLGQMNTREKISEALLLMWENFGLTEQNELNVPFTREDIANIAGTNAEQVMKQLTEFEQEGFISKAGRKIEILNLEGLKNIIKKYNQHTILA